MFNPTEFVPLGVTQRTTKRAKEKGILTIVLSEKQGKRIQFSESLVKELHIANSVKLGFVKDALVVGIDLPGEDNLFHLKRLGKKKVLYSAPVVHRIAEHMHLDFSACVSYTFYDVEIEEHKNNLIAMFTKEER